MLVAHGSKTNILGGYLSSFNLEYRLTELLYWIAVRVMLQHMPTSGRLSPTQTGLLPTRAQTRSATTSPVSLTSTVSGSIANSKSSSLVLNGTMSKVNGTWR